MAQQTLANGETGLVTRTKLNENTTELYAHVASTSNPHSVTKTQVGLGSVENLAPSAMPVSTAQQSALDLKQNTLVSGSNIKTVGGVNVLGAGDVAVNPGYHADVLSFRQRVETAGGLVDLQTLAALDKFVKTGVRDGWYAKALEIYPFVGTSLISALQKLKYTSQAALTNVGGLFVEADYSPDFGLGVYSVSGNRQLLTGFIPSANSVGNTNCFLFAASTDFGINSADGLIVGDLGTHVDTADWHYRSDYQICSVGGPQSYAPTPGHQHPLVLGASSNGSTAMLGWIEGIQVGNGGTINGLWTGEVALFRNYYSGQTRNQAGKIGCVVIGGTTALTAAEGSALARAIRKLQKECGRARYSDDAVLVGIGDSITAGTGGTGYIGFFEKMAHKLGLPFRNLGQPSIAVSAAFDPCTAANAQAANYALEPGEVAVIALGTNDMNAGVAYTTIASAVGTIITAVTAARKKVIVCSTPYSSDTLATPTFCRNSAGAIAALATAGGHIFVDLDRAIRDKTTPGDWMVDANHPNNAGHILYAERIALAYRGVLCRELALDFGSVSAQSELTIEVEMLTVLVGQKVTVQPPGTLNAGLICTGYVSATDTVTVKLLNITSGGIDPASGVFTIYVEAPR